MRLTILSSILVVMIILSSFGVMSKIMKLDTNFGRRTDCWIISAELIKVNPLFGMGIGIYKTINVYTSGDYGDTIWHEAHNDYLQYTIELGIIGILLFLLLIINSIRNFTYKEGIGNAFFCMFISYLFLMFGSFPCEVPSIAILGLIGFLAVERL